MFYNWGLNFNRCMPHYHNCYCGNNVYAQVYQFGIMSRMLSMFMPQQPVFVQPQTYNFPSVQYNNNSSFDFSVFNSCLNNLYRENSQILNNRPNWFEIFNNTYNNYSNLASGKVSETTENDTASCKTSTPASAKTLGKPFLDKLKQVAKNINCDYKDLLAVMNSESGLDPKCKNGNVAVGLIQFTKIAIDDVNRKHGLNLTKEKILNMSALEQLDLAEKVLKLSKGYAGFSADYKLSAAELYAITFLPGRANREVLCSKSEKGNSYYAQNSGLDINGDNKITKSELTQRVNSKRVNESAFA